ncbi:hypothetical protein [Mesorhizobium sp. 1M-11]|uniref:hypothetical protein n=1 Tax=Mesorhizobium sp. 1M-11 TaxID=1529006 RepID=UPI00137B85FA|nr:hypothetical protein [Mesorhizobium sp. 1M-11]
MPALVFVSRRRHALGSGLRCGIVPIARNGLRRCIPDFWQLGEIANSPTTGKVLHFSIPIDENGKMPALVHGSFSGRDVGERRSQ